MHPSKIGKQEGTKLRFKEMKYEMITVNVGRKKIIKEIFLIFILKNLIYNELFLSIYRIFYS